jgi:hypothetical protein
MLPSQERLDQLAAAGNWREMAEALGLGAGTL